MNEKKQYLIFGGGSLKQYFMVNTPKIGFIELFRFCKY